MEAPKFKDTYVYYRKQLREVVHRIMIARMIAQNIAELIPAGWELQQGSWATLEYKPAEGSSITVADMDKACGRLARKLRNEPTRTVGKDKIDFTFYLYPRTGDYSCTMVSFLIGNSESCDFEVKRKMQKTYVPTGYCKKLAEAKYL